MIRFMLSIVDLIVHKSRLHSLSRVLLCLVNGATGQKFSLQPIDPALSRSVYLSWKVAVMYFLRNSETIMWRRKIPV